ncbi:2-oxoglutarate dehydrogenase complex dihydrolipoyllysine-residue succinyltransferase [Marinibactrum halimedae]|uniref:Dihydrolipoyllysine-residue succinyltransferase component of 2-oxoglutarate dehydrogenase complex n=1 Tax=Marinibactrum halimedae TaxID=1444977 RepID=A0AA37T9F9_9GAMM|nr:2-oxoglutarate dehydrogenase complex dihydrolipoyllysine-residue succinyltransferase [Marinibactrum halimedae]MCD9458674.1 2-oxoglutarate dehydrogenase complex dihydrolipoyllysine-residue succinyltransferase [Marinibactrum halimedae]GLS25960.1 dihydrolipoyllysine-residue succinyltransferase component of 2-oxoglutarate dehydrogenase complex [Marinibactrum halimedae]
MTTEIKAPTFPESVQDGVIATWHKKPGEAVSRDELLVDIETDKVVLEVVAPADGVLGEVLKAEGDTVLSNEVIAYVQPGEGVSNGAPVVAAAPQTAAVSAEVTDIKAPTFPESVQDGVVATWHKAEGEAVSRDELLVDIETDKVVLEVVAPTDGVLSKVMAAEGETIASNQVIGQIGGGAATVSAPAAESAPVANASGEAAPASPAARKLAEEKGVDLSSIAGTGKDGRITKEDVVNAAAAPKPAASTAAESKAPAAPAVKAPTVELPGSGDRIEKRVPMTRLRKRIAERLLNATSNTAMLTTFNEVNMKPLMDLRKQYKDTFEKTHDGARLGFMGMFTKAACEALKRFPQVNASIDGDDIVYHGYQDVGVAVSTPNGLVVPVLRDVDDMNIAQIESGIRDYGLRARDGKLGIEEMTGGTFTITNGGVFGSLLSTPILNPPQSAILGMHKIQDRPMAVDGKVEILPMMYLALSYDHRILDGKDAVQFLVAIKEMIEDPARILLQV